MCLKNYLEERTHDVSRQKYQIRYGKDCSIRMVIIICSFQRSELCVTALEAIWKLKDLLMIIEALSIQ